MHAAITSAELVLLGLVAERPRHGYELAAVIEDRGIRAWTALGFSSIYYALNKLESRGLVASERGATARARRTYRITADGVAAAVGGTRCALEDPVPMHDPVLIGMANSPLLPPDQVAESSRRLNDSVARSMAAIETARAGQEPAEPFVAAIFEHGLAMLRAERQWIEDTLSTLEEARMPNYDVKKELKHLYVPERDDFQLVDVPSASFLMIDGHGDPNTSSAYREAIQALYAASYAVRAAAKAGLGRVHTVAPLEALWSAEDMDAFRRRDKSTWDWTTMIRQPDWITAGLVAEALTAARKKKLPGLDLVRFEDYAEGLSVQILHVGSYDDEGPTLERLHQEYLPAHGLAPSGRHHEIYLSDARKTEPARLRTILRQPVAAA